MTDESQRRLDLGRSILFSYSALNRAVCAAITGSSAEGEADRHSDLDMTVYYDVLPAEADLRRVRMEVSDGTLVWSMGRYDDGEFAEAFVVDGIEVQIGHTTVERWESAIDGALAGTEPGSPIYKAMSGALISVPVHGAERLAAWQARIRAYPDALRIASVRHHLKFFRVWALVDWLESRDAALWFRQMLVEASFNLLGVAAGLSRRYFTSFQFKRTRAFVATLDTAPPDLADRLEGLWGVPPHEAAARVRALVVETVALVERELPEVDTARVRASLA